MADIAHSIDLNLTEKLRDPEYRQKFFLAESSAHIAAQLIALRKRRDLKQGQVAELIGTKQPAISRIEQADYQSWSFSVLRKIAGALDARVRVFIEPSEDVLYEYNDDDQQSDRATQSGLDALRELLGWRNPVPPKSEIEKKESKLAGPPADEASAANHDPGMRDLSAMPEGKPKSSADFQRIPQDRLETSRLGLWN